MKETDVEVLRQIISRTDKTGNEKVELLVEFIESQLKTCNLHIVRVSTWENATEEQKQPFYDKAVELASDTMFCTRVWSAWGYGTMTEDDFVNANEESEFIGDIAKAIWQGY